LELWRPNRQPGRICGLLFTALACCVFLWGLQYKLSLYDPPRATSHQVPVAKLLSKNELSDTQKTSAYTQTKPEIKFLLAVANVLPLILLMVWAFGNSKLRLEIAANQPPLDLQQSLRESFFVRPPPIRTA
jgi:hypothetical protein